jgi:hypothetical protein
LIDGGEKKQSIFGENSDILVKIGKKSTKDLIGKEELY